MLPTPPPAQREGGATKFVLGFSFAVQRRRTVASLGRGQRRRSLRRAHLRLLAAAAGPTLAAAAKATLAAATASRPASAYRLLVLSSCAATAFAFEIEPSTAPWTVGPLRPVQNTALEAAMLHPCPKECTCKKY